MHKKILLTGARSPITLDLARLLAHAGHEIHVADTSKVHVCRFSNAVKKIYSFPSPRFEPQKFADSLLRITKANNFDIIIPNWEEIFCLSRYISLFPKSCRIFSSDFELLNILHNKWLFANKQQELGILTPKTYLVACNEDLQQVPFQSPFILKASYSRASQKVKKIDPRHLFLDFEISYKNPWIAQEWIKGKKYCSYSICHSGEIKAHAVYPVEYSIDESSCLTFESIDHEKIFHWVQSFVKKIQYTGQISFDFIESSEGNLYAIECNPRATSGLHLFEKENRIDKAFFNQNTSVITPNLGNRRQIAAGMVIYGWRSKHLENNFSKYLKKLFSVKDVVFCIKDIKPFLLQPFVFSVYLLNSLKLRANLPTTFTYDLDFDNE
ncbi:MAG: ATP-grasp domain-containing protein [Simkaniaceae bacterium]